MGGGILLFARWTTEWDCKDETQFYWCIKDDGFDLSCLKAKIRYEINKGKKNFDTKIINPKEHVDDIYDVYLNSLKGYKEPYNILTKEEISTVIHRGWSQDECRFFASFDKITGKMCGYADVYERDLFLPISSMHSRVEYERKGVNLALIAGIVEWYVQLEKQGAYLCDGARNIVHETNFQDFLIKYFGFRKAYCRLHIVYRPIVRVLVSGLFPFRHLLAKVNNNKVKNVCAVLKMEAWKQGLPE